MELFDIPGAGASFDFAEKIIDDCATGKLSYDEAHRQLVAACKGDVCLYFYEMELAIAREEVQ